VPEIDRAESSMSRPVGEVTGAPDLAPGPASDPGTVDVEPESTPDTGCWRLDAFEAAHGVLEARPAPVRHRPIDVTVLDGDGTIWTGPIGLTRIVAKARVATES